MRFLTVERIGDAPVSHHLMRSTRTAFAFGLLAFAQGRAHSQNINKCLVNGKTIYSDRACPSNAVRKSVEMHHAEGIISPDRDTVEDTIHRIEDENWVNAVPGRSITRTTNVRFAAIAAYQPVFPFARLPA
jgi:hypothetical protein